MNLPHDFRELLEEFDREGVEAVVIGGYAFAFHAQPRATKDLDLLLEGSAANLERAARALARYGAPASVVIATRGLGETEVAYLGQPPLQATWEGVRIRVIALDDLIANKRAAGRPQDVADVANLERVRAMIERG